MKKIYLLLTFCVLSFAGICQDKSITFNKHKCGDTISFNELKTGSLYSSDSTCNVKKFSLNINTEDGGVKEALIEGNKITEEAFNFLKLENWHNKKVWFSYIRCEYNNTIYLVEDIYLILK